MISLLIFIITISPIVALVSILVAVTNGKKVTELEEENNNLRENLQMYIKKYGYINDEIKNIEIEKDIAIKENNEEFITKQNIVDDELDSAHKNIDIQTKDEVEERESFSLAIKEYIDNNNISQGNLLFALGVLFVSVAGIVFATTTWQTIPNIFKVIIILIASLLVRTLSFFAKNKFKLIKTSITLYVLFCILISLIPLSMGFFHMFGDYLAIGGKGQFLLYAISLLVFIVSFAMFTYEYNLEKLGSNLLYVINIELLLIMLNWTKRFDLIMYLLSIYNLVLLFISNALNIDNKTNFFIKNMKEVVNNTLVFLSIISITNTTHGVLMSILSIGFAIFYLNDSIVINTKSNIKDDTYKYIIASIFLIASCIRFNIDYSFKWTSEYLATIIVILSIAFIKIKKFKEEKFVYMIYIMAIASFLSLYKDFMQSDITIRFLASLIANLIVYIVLCIKAKEGTFKYIKMFYYLIFVISFIRYLSIEYHLESFSIVVIANILLISAYVVSNLIDKWKYKNKFADVWTNIIYKALIVTSVVVAAIMLKSNDSILKKYVVYDILVIFALAANHFNMQNSKNDKNLVELDLIQDAILFAANCFIIKINPFAAVIVFIAMLYDYIKNESQYGEQVLLFAYLAYTNLLAYFVLKEYRIFILMIAIVFYFVVLSIINYKKIKKIDLCQVEITSIVNLVVIYILERFYYCNLANTIVVLLVFNILMIYLYCYRGDNYKKVIAVVVQLSVFMLTWLLYRYIIKEGIIDSKLYYEPLYVVKSGFCFWYYVVFMVIAIARLFIESLIDSNRHKTCAKISNNIVGLTKYCMPVALIMCVIRIIFSNLFYDSYYHTKFSINLYMLAIFLTIYIIAILVRIRILKKEYRSRNIVLLIIGQAVTLELLFIYIIDRKLLPMYEKYELTSSIKYFGRPFNILFYMIILNFLIAILYRCLISKFVNNSALRHNEVNEKHNDIQKKIEKTIANLIEENSDIIKTYNWTFDLMVSKIVKIYKPILNLIVNVGSAILLFILILRAYGFNTTIFSGKNMHPSYISIIRYVILAIIININLVNKKISIATKVFIYLIPYMIINIIGQAAIIKNSAEALDYIKWKYIALFIIFTLYYIFAFVIKNRKCKIKIKDINVSYFAIANLSIILYLNDSISTLSRDFLYKYIGMIDLLFAGVFVLQFKTENKRINKIIYTLSMFLIMMALLIQNVVDINGYRLEYYLLIIGLFLFVIDKLIWRFEDKISNIMWIVYHVIAFGAMFIKVLTSNLIVNTILYGIIMFITLIISFIIKKYYHFVISAVYMLLTALYVTRNFWLSIAWWAYLLIVGILLIAFATKNEQLKKENKNFIIVLKELNDKIKSKFM